MQTLQRVPDPRKPRGVRHRLTTVLAVALGATLAGAQSFVAIAEWAADAAPEVLARLGVGGAVPSESTIRRCLQRLAPDKLDELIGAWMWLRTSTISGRRVIAFDGKTLRGARDAAGNLVHLLAGLCQHTGTVVAQLAVAAKTNEIPLLTKILETIGIAVQSSPWTRYVDIDIMRLMPRWLLCRYGGDCAGPGGARGVDIGIIIGVDRAYFSCR